MDLILRNITKAYGEHVVLDRFTHTFPEGGVTVITGRSGRGKTTLLRLVAGLEPADAGEILGVPEGGISMVFQEDRLPASLTAPACLRCVLPRTPERDATVEGALRALGLGDALDQPVREFSGGMRRRVALARALLYPSPLVLLDEPFKGLDEETRRAAVDFARPLLEGRTVLLVTHDGADVDAFDARTLSLDA